MPLKKFNDYLFCIISGIITAVSFSVRNLNFLCFFSLIPIIFIFITKKMSAKKVFCCIFLYSLSYYLPLLSWLWELYPLTFYGLSSFTSAVFLASSSLLIGLIASGFMCLAFLPFNVLCGTPVKNILIFSFLYILGEAFQERSGVLGFPWGRLGVIPYNNVTFIQSASVFGSLFLSLLILLINGFLAYSILMLPDIPKKAIAPVAVALCLFLINISFGVVRLGNAKYEQANKNVLVVQGNLSSILKWDTSVDDTLNLYIGISEKIISADTDLVVWPETAVPTDLKSNSAVFNALKAFTARNNVTLITGVFDRRQQNGEDFNYNSMCALDPLGNVSGTYYKQKLVPMGEYIPFEKFLRSNFPSLMDGISTSISVGSESAVVPTVHGKIGGLICYESVFPILSRDLIKNGAELIVIISNDSWFGQSAAIEQHHAQAVMRAVESGRYAIRAGNTGMSSIIDPHGRIKASIPPFNPGAFHGSVAFIKDRTIYSYMGDIVLLPSIYMVAYALYVKLKGLKSH